MAADQIMLGVRDSTLQEKLVNTESLTVTKAIKIVTTYQVGDDPRSTYVRCLRVVRQSRVGVRRFRVVLWTYTFPSS